MVVKKIKELKTKKVKEPKTKKVKEPKTKKVKEHKVNKVNKTVTNTLMDTETNTVMDTETNTVMDTVTNTVMDTETNTLMDTVTDTVTDTVIDSKINLPKYNNINPNQTNFYNKLLMKSINEKDIQLILDNKKKNNYDNTFDDILSFRKKFTKMDLDNIDCIIYHDENSDGMFSAAIAYNYLRENSNKKIELIGEKPGKINFITKIRGKNIIIVDLSLREDYLKEVIKVSKRCIVIDDHNKTLLNNPDIFNGMNHAACSYTWKFFYPRKSIPNTIIYIDSSDGKLFLDFIYKSFTNLLAQSLGFRFTHDKSKRTMHKKKTGELFIELWNLFNDDVKFRLYITIGNYFNEVTESLKEQIAINAQPAKFQGYNVGVLNFNAPALSKPVGRQIITNFRNSGMAIDFAVLWGYEYTSNAYRIQIIDDHKQNKIGMDYLARKLGEKGGSSKGGQGHFHVGNFYWQRKPGQDIWDLFTKKYI